MRKTKAKCPKCKSKNLILSECTECWTQWEQIDGEIDYDHGDLNPGDIDGVYGDCKDCGHKWKFRCATINDVLKN